MPFLIRLFARFCRVALLGSFVSGLSVAAAPLNLAAGWNLLGNSDSAAIDVARTFGDSIKISTVWKWNRAASKWAIYAPSLTPSALAIYAQNAGYEGLTTIGSKEGFWVKAAQAAVLTDLPPLTGASVTLQESDLLQGWNLVGSADNKPPAQLNTGLNNSLNAAGKALVSVWAWEASSSKWKFYDPSLQAQGATAWADYLSGHGYLPFTSALGTTEGFWLNIGAATSVTDQVLLAGAATAGDWLTFTLNVQDFAYPDRSAATVDHVITLHEKYGIPVDIYLTDTMLANFEASYPTLMTRLRTSPYVALNYHIRPPKPYYSGYDWAGLSNLPATDQLSQIRSYESHVTDLASGLPGAATGGFIRLKQLTGASPVIASFQAASGLYASVSQVFLEMGASMTISHSAPYINLGTTNSGLYVRPEHFDLKLFESPGLAASGLIEAAFAAAHNTPGAASPYVVGVKMHDNDFFALASAWTNTYINAPRRPPWNVTTLAGLKSDADALAQRTLYEGSVAWADSNRSRIAVANARGLGAALAAAPALPLLYLSGTMHIENSPARWPNPDNLMAFFQRAVSVGKVGSQTSGMRWSIGADLGWLTGEPRAGEIIRTLSALGVEWDVHVHSVADRAAAVQKIIALGGTPTTVLSGVMASDLDMVGAAVTGTNGYPWQAASLWGIVRTGNHRPGSEDFSSGLWLPRSSSDWQAHDPAKSLIAVGGGGRSLAGAESLASQLVQGYTAPVYSVTVMVDQVTLTVSDAANASTSSDGIVQIEAFASRMGARSNVRWATLSGTAAAWRAAGAWPSRIASSQ